jgi:NADH-quinone oxidoreductase subunit I
MSFGLGLLRGMGITMRHFVDTYVGEFKHLGRPYDEKALKERQSTTGKGIFTVQYPEEKWPVPEAFRFIPFLVYEPVIDEATGKPKIDAATGKEQVGVERCTACGICAKVCPPQCIWIVRATTPEGKPRPKPSEFYIDIDVCMNCGMCAEFCPFDAIKMDHDYELANYERDISHIYDMPKLMQSTTYYSKIHPLDWEREEAERKAKEAAKAKKS